MEPVVEDVTDRQVSIHSRFRRENLQGKEGTPGWPCARLVGDVVAMRRESIFIPEPPGAAVVSTARWYPAEVQ